MNQQSNYKEALFNTFNIVKYKEFKGDLDVPFYTFLKEPEKAEEFFMNNLVEIARNVKRSIEYAIDEFLMNVPIMNVYLFKTPVVYILNRNNFDKALEISISILEGEEEYEECGELLELLKMP